MLPAKDKYEVTTTAGKIFQHDKLIKLIAIPVLSIGIPNATGLIANRAYSFVPLLINYSLFIFLAWIIWQGNVQLMVWLKRYKNEGDYYYKRFLTLLLSVILYTIVISTCGLLAWQYFSTTQMPGARSLSPTVFLITGSATLITSIYENFYLNLEQQDILSRVEQLNLAKTHAELVALKNQIDPHFIFNSLNTLSYLISSHPVNAKLYNDTLAKVYHYILINRERNLVMLREELEFIANYFYLLKIRFDDGVNMTIEISDMEAEELLILPISLQVLMENVIKHNELDASRPLTIHIAVSSNYITVKNEIHPKAYSGASSQIGLTNLDNRYKLLTGKNIIIYKNSETFAVRLPILNFKK